MTKIKSIQNRINSIFCFITRKGTEEELKKKIKDSLPEDMQKSKLDFSFIDISAINKDEVAYIDSFYIEVLDRMSEQVDVHMKEPGRRINTFIFDLDSIENKEALELIEGLENTLFKFFRQTEIIKDKFNFYIFYKEQVYIAEDFLKEISPSAPPIN